MRVEAYNKSSMMKDNDKDFNKYEVAQQEENQELEKSIRSRVLSYDNKVYPYTNTLLFHKNQYHFTLNSSTPHLYDETGHPISEKDPHFLTQRLTTIHHTPQLFNTNHFTIVSQEVIEPEKITMPDDKIHIIPVVKSETFTVQGTPTEKNVRDKKITATLMCASLLGAIAWVNFKAFDAIASLH